MNLDYLLTYIQVVRLGSFSEVAKKLSISQPAVSFQIQKLERDLGMKLVDRGQKSIAMTEAGRRLLRFAEVVEKEHKRLFGDLDRLRQDVSGDVVIAASTMPGEVLVPPMVGEFRGLHPNVGVRVDVFDSGTVIERVVDGIYDVGFCGSPPVGRDLESFRVAGDEIILIAFPEHPFAGRGEISFLDLEGEALILREETSGTQKSVNNTLARAGVDAGKLSTGLVLGTTQAVVAAVEAHLGIAFVSNLATKKSMDLGLVKRIPIQGLKLDRSFYCVYRKERVVSRLLEEFIAFVRARAMQGSNGDAPPDPVG